MCALRRVTDSVAGPRAVGILVPPGPRTVLILRPRALNWDLLLLAHGEQKGPFSPFQEFSQADARLAAKELLQAMLDWSRGHVSGRVEAVSALNGSTHQVQAEIGRFNMIACKRLPGQPYKPIEFTAMEDAQALAEILTAKLQVSRSIDQEVYLNTRNLSN
jgi:hypothetical protein